MQLRRDSETKPPAFKQKATASKPFAKGKAKELYDAVFDEEKKWLEKWKRELVIKLN